jgi:2-polyprenyl-3-methyl-5-hydroxy-6-metoxy-1,4-benzoquinol methylase
MNLNNQLNKTLFNNKYQNNKTTNGIEINTCLVNYIKTIEDSINTNILDYGCGTGRCIEEYFNSHQYGNYYIYDIVDDILLYYKTHFKEILIYNIESNIKFNNIICHRMLHSCVNNYIDHIQYLKNHLKDEGTIFLSVRSTECIEYNMVKEACINNIFYSKHKNIKFFTIQELIDIFNSLDLYIINYGSFIEKSSFMKKNNHYHYIIGQYL